jgi:peptidoglycan hydrolase-like protein with peptidoglycan-binding domain
VITLAIATIAKSTSGILWIFVAKFLFCRGTLFLFMNYRVVISSKKTRIFIKALAPCMFFLWLLPLYAESVSGGGYTVTQTITSMQGDVFGNGFTVTSASQVQGDTVSGGGLIAQPVFGASSVQATTTPLVPGTVIINSGGYFILPEGNNSRTFSTTTNVISSSTILTSNGSTCSTRIAIAQPISSGATTNTVDDVKKLETFLNLYEQENLPVNGIYEKNDIAAVKRWQKKYKNEILVPMRLKNPTGTIYYWSMKQIERQTTVNCGAPIIVRSCPHFTEGVSFGDSGEEVKKIQQFLNIVQGEKIRVTGVYHTKTRDAVKRFQRLYKKDIVSVLKLSFITGNWNMSTVRKANKIIGCDILQ